MVRADEPLAVLSAVTITGILGDGLVRAARTPGEAGLTATYLGGGHNNPIPTP
ncbi:MAG TPA: hypothetical protein VNW15_11025 [Rhizomicrobium sp.]|nr:hypothetical protein [Rhizomicrobium sp.]